MAKRYKQKQGVDYDKFFVLVARIEIVCLLLAISAQMKWKIFQLYVKSVFLNGYLNEEAYIE